MSQQVIIFIFLCLFFNTKGAKSFYAVPYNQHHLYYGLSWHPDKVWHSYEYHLQNTQKTSYVKVSTVGLNFQFSKDVKMFGILMERTMAIRSRKYRKIWRLILPIVGLNPNYLTIEGSHSFNLKPKVGLLLRSGWRTGRNALAAHLKLCYGMDIPIGVQNIHQYNPHEFSVHLGLTFGTRKVLGRKWISMDQGKKKSQKKPRATF